MQEDRERGDINERLVGAETAAGCTDQRNCRHQRQAEQESVIAKNCHDWRICDERRGHVRVDGQRVPVVERPVQFVGCLDDRMAGFREEGPEHTSGSTSRHQFLDGQSQWCEDVKDRARDDQNVNDTPARLTIAAGQDAHRYQAADVEQTAETSYHAGPRREDVNRPAVAIADNQKVVGLSHVVVVATPRVQIARDEMTNAVSVNGTAEKEEQITADARRDFQENRRDR